MTDLLWGPILLAFAAWLWCIGFRMRTNIPLTTDRDWQLIRGALARLGSLDATPPSAHEQRAIRRVTALGAWMHSGMFMPLQPYQTAGDWKTIAAVVARGTEPTPREWRAVKRVMRFGDYWRAL